MICLGLGFSASAVAASAQQGSVVQGVVKDLVSGRPIPGAAVAIGTRAVDTDSTGHFRLCDVSVGLQLIEAEATGYDSVRIAVQVSQTETIAEVELLRQAPTVGTPWIVLHENWSVPPHRALFVVDGVPVFFSPSGCESAPDGVRRLDSLRAEDIATLTTMKGPEAVRRFGPAAAKGAVLITTRAGEPERRGEPRAP